MEAPEADQRPKAQVIDLMQALKASLGKKEARGPPFSGEEADQVKPSEPGSGASPPRRHRRRQPRRARSAHG